MFRVSFAVSVATVLLAACGGGGDSGSSGNQPAVAVNPPPAVVVAPPTTVNPPAAVNPPTIVPNTNNPTPPAPLAGANIRISKGLPVSEAACAPVPSTTLEVSGQVTAIWLKCTTQGLPLERVEIGTASKQIGVEYGNAEVGIVRFEASNDVNASVIVDTATRTIKFKHASLPLNKAKTVAGIGGALPTQAQSIEIDGELKY